MSSVHGFSLRTGLSAEQQRLCLPKISSGRKKDRITMLHALPSQALTSIWMSLILKLFASDIIFANHRLIERNQQVGANSRNLLSPSCIVICGIFVAVFCNLRYIFVTAKSRSCRTRQAANL